MFNFHELGEGKKYFLGPFASILACVLKRCFVEVDVDVDRCRFEEDNRRIQREKMLKTKVKLGVFVLLQVGIVDNIGYGFGAHRDAW